MIKIPLHFVENTFCFEQENLLNSNLHGGYYTVLFETRFRNSLLCQTLYINKFTNYLKKNIIVIEGLNNKIKFSSKLKY